MHMFLKNSLGVLFIICICIWSAYHVHAQVPSAFADDPTQATDDSNRLDELKNIENGEGLNVQQDSDSCNSADPLYNEYCRTLNNLEDTHPAYTLETDPPFPEPNTSANVSIKAGAMSVDNIQSVEWTVRGKTFTSRSTNTVVSINDLDDQTTVKARVFHYTDAGLVEYKKILTLTLTPMIFDLHWEGKTVVPPLYEGVKYMGPNTDVQVQAYIRLLQNNILYTEKDFNFRWERESLPHISKGATAIVSGTDYTSSPLRVACFIKFKYGDLSFDKSIQIPIVNPYSVIYQQDNLNGKNHLTLQKNSTIANRFTLLSFYPLYTNVDSFVQGLNTYEWDIAGNKKNQKRTVRIESSGEGTVGIGIFMTPGKESDFLQSVDQSLSLNFVQ
ncbi:MAG: hypothetical protein QM526_00230 [Alphaproteobacteria bacterium]|nr:hypothetical protein [Alphaproteobacteria bacterium]